MVSIPEGINVTASYYIAPLKDNPNKDGGMEFLELVLSPRGQDILMRHGFNHRGEHE